VDKIYNNYGDNVAKTVKEIIPKSYKERVVGNFSDEIARKLSILAISQGAQYFVDHIDEYLSGNGPALLDVIDSGGAFDALKDFSKKHIYTAEETRRMEVAGFKVIHGLLDYYSHLPAMSREAFVKFMQGDKLERNSGLDLQWRIYKSIPKGLLEVYCRDADHAGTASELNFRWHLVVDHISGMTDHSALRHYQNIMGISLDP
jgi:dGTPase